MATTPSKPDAPVIDQTQEIERLQRELAAEKAKSIPGLNLAFTSATEIDGGVDDDGKQWWFYKIDLPPSGGIDIRINGVAYYHGEQYKVGTDVLRTLKDIVHRSWAHEQSIHGTNENFYRQPKNQVLRGGGR